MADDAIDLDQRRGMFAQRATEIRRRRSGYEAVQSVLREQQEQLENLFLTPSATWPEAAEKAAYLLTLFASSIEACDPRRQKLIASVLEDLRRLSGEQMDCDSRPD
jgi:hypothetical protein